jgi:hypothetical protein
MSSEFAPKGAERSARRASAGLYLLALAVAACSAPTSTAPPDMPSAALASLTVTPDSFYVVQGDTFDLQASGSTITGERVTPALTWSATGGRITSEGRYFAGLDTGVYAVTAEAANGFRASAVVFLGSNVTEVVVTPKSVTLSPGEMQQFTARGVTITDDTIPVKVIWSATGGTITQAGLFTAGADGGPISVVAELAPPEINGVPVITPSRRRLASGAAGVQLNL